MAGGVEQEHSQFIQTPEQAQKVQKDKNLIVDKVLNIVQVLLLQNQAISVIYISASQFKTNMDNVLRGCFQCL